MRSWCCSSHEKKNKPIVAVTERPNNASKLDHFWYNLLWLGDLQSRTPPYMDHIPTIQVVLHMSCIIQVSSYPTDHKWKIIGFDGHMIHIPSQLSSNMYIYIGIPGKKSYPELSWYVFFDCKWVFGHFFRSMMSASSVSGTSCPVIASRSSMDETHGQI